MCVFSIDFFAYQAVPLQTVDENSPSFQIYQWRVFIDLSFFIIITTIGLNIVIAVMVDRFTELREERVCPY